MTRVLTQRELNRALLARQLLLRRSSFHTLERLPSAADRELRDEAAALVRFMEATSASYAVERSAAD